MRAKMGHTCNKEKEIGIIQIDTTETKQRVKVIEKRLFGNGIKGLIQKWDDAIEFITTYREDIKKVRPALEFLIAQKEKGRIENMSRADMLKWCVAIGSVFLASLFAIIGFLIRYSIKQALGG